MTEQQIQRVLGDHEAVSETPHLGKVIVKCGCGDICPSKPFHRAHQAAKVAEALCDDLSRSEGKSSELCDCVSESHTAAQVPECDCYPGGFTPDTYEGPQEDCPVHGRSPAQVPDISARVSWLASHEASVTVTDALTARGIFMLRPKVREVLREASRALLDRPNGGED